MRTIILCASLFFSLLFAGCGGSGNSAPVANAGADQNVVTGSLVTLDGSASSDANGDTLSYRWSLNSTPAGSSASLSDPAAVRPTFTADVDGSYVMQLIVNDGTVDSAPQSVTITAATGNSAPVANAGADQNVVTGSLVTLDGSASSDANGDTLSYRWSLTSTPAGSSASLSDPAAVRPTFTANVDGSYVMQLIVNDGTVDSAPQSVTITAATGNSTPVANAGADQNVVTASLVTLDGSASSDADGDTLSYRWSLTSTPAGSSATLSDPAAVRPTFTADVDGAYVIQLIVNDGTADSAPQSVTITAATGNSAPVANAGADQNVVTGSLVTLDGSASSDADGDTLSYRWSLINAPAGSAATLSDPSAAQPNFAADVEGDYLIQLIVNDGTIDSIPDSMTVSASAIWGPVELVINSDAVAGIDNYLGHPVPVRFDANTIHLYFTGYAFKLYAVVPAEIYRITSTDNGATWSPPERMAQLEGNYQSYPTAYHDGKLLLVWHNGLVSNLYHTRIDSPDGIIPPPTLYVAIPGRAIIWTSHWNGSLMGMWHTNSIADYSPFVGSIEPTTASLSGIDWPFGGTFYLPTPISADTALVLTGSGLFRTGFNGSAFHAPNELLPFPDADNTLAYGGATFHHAALDQTSDFLYFTGYNQGTSKGAIYRTKLLR